MKLLIVACLVAAAAADVSHILNNNRKDESKAQIVKQGLEVSPEGNYQWSIETENGINADAEGNVEITNVRTGNEEEPQAILRVQGQAGWTSPEGEPIQFTYVADENGYQPQGSHLPTPPPIPEAILRSLEYIKAHAPQREN